MDGVWRGVHDKVIGRGNLAQTQKHAPQQRREITTVGTWARLFKQIVVLAIEQPDLEWHSGGIGTQRDVIPLRVHDSFSLAHFLLHDVAKYTTLLLGIPLPRRAQFVKNSSWHEGGSGHLRMRVRSLLGGQGAIILEYGN